MDAGHRFAALPERAPWVLAGTVLTFGWLAVWLGQDFNFDLLNYHYYVGYAFLHGRMNRDVVPGGIQTFVSPVLNAFHYLGIAHLPPRFFGFLLGALHGLNMPILFLLGVAVLSAEERRRARSIALLASLVGAIGPDAVSLVGTTFGDNLVSIPGLLALVLVVRSVDPSRRPPHPATLVGAGVLAGAATGLKLTMGTYHVALVVALAVATWRRESSWRATVLFLLGSLLGFAPTGGFLCWWLYERFGNPFFPFANGLFRSPFFRFENFRFARSLPRTPYDLVRPALDIAIGRTEGIQEIALRDARFLLLLVVSLLCLALLVLGPLRHGRRGLRWRPFQPQERALLVYWLAAYIVWVVMFCYYRYLAILEFTAPLLLFVLVGRLIPGRQLPRVVLGIALVLALSTSSGSWGRRRWQPAWLQMTIPPMGLQPHSLVLLVGQPISYAIPSFREDARFALVTLDEFGTAAPWRERVAELIATHRGPILLLSTYGHSRPDAGTRVAAFGLRPTGHYEQAGQGPLRLRLCELERSP
jgi:hypothetical protein